MNSLTATSEVNQRRPGVFSGVGRADGDRMFRAAVRHSKHVRVLRIAVPAGVVAVVLGASAFAMLAKPLRMLAKVPIDVGSLVVSGTKIMMQQPKLAGFTSDNRRYDLTAQAAGQDITKPDVVELHGIRATMEMKDQSVFETTAQDGLYNHKTELLTLKDNVVVTSTTGFKAWLSEAVIETKSAKIVSEKPVKVKSGTWTVEGNRMELTDSGEVVRFERGVSVLLPPENAPAYASAEGGKR
jgi:lipopolysaccharide export system protein LptC